MRNCKLTPCVLVALLLVGVLHLEAAMATDFTYGEALDKSLMFFEAQRSGKLPSDQRVKWRGDSGLTDGLAQGVNLVGGYYDAGDHVKFGLPMAFTVTMLSWGAIEFRKEITDLAQMGQTLWAIRWGTDYFMKAHPQPNVLWGQVGDGDSDHYCWERPEDMTTPRTAYKIDENHPGSDLAGETAAALASAAIAFQPYNSSYSALLLVHAKQLFTFADRFRGLYDESIGSAKNFYTSSGYSDELLWAAAWLYQATNEEYYLKYVVDNAVYMGGTGWAVKEFSWDNKYAGVQILLSKVLLEGKGGAYTSTLKQYQAKADYFGCACLQKNEGYNVHKTPETEPTLSGSGPLIGLFSKLQSLNGINVPGYNRGSPNSHHQTIPSPSPNQHEKQVPNKVSGTPIKFIHSISNTWSIGKMTYYRHKVILKNTSQKPVTDVKLMIENLQGPLWGLSPTTEKNTYELLQWQKVLQPASECTFVYIQGGPQAKISILSYH
ncbi:hypothetical protein GBA52_002258 [Prunus armeniaca]|nr:hypothetical protein GBA52_002258 [Prunus armeniaca]